MERAQPTPWWKACVHTDGRAAARHARVERATTLGPTRATVRRMAADAPLAAAASHVTDVVYVARGVAPLAPTIAAIAQLSAWSDPSRLRFHLLAGERCGQDLDRAPLSAWFMRYNAPEQPLRVVNASDAALFARLSATGRAWLKYTKSLSDKAHSYTVPKPVSYTHLTLPTTPYV